MNTQPDVPVVLVFAGSDPSGGAGVQADIETLSSMGCHAAAVITAITVQDTVDIVRYEPIDGALILEQARTVLEDIPVSAIKIGMLGSDEAVEAIFELLNDYPEIPVILDPVIQSGGGSELADGDVLDAMIDLLFPLVTVLTPNSIEARGLAPEADTLDACAQELMDQGCEYVLITGSHENTPTVINKLYGDQQLIDSYQWERLSGSYHGSGCTLSVAIAGLIAQDMDPATAVYEAQEYTWEALKNSYRIGMGQNIPNRFFWAHEDKDDAEAKA